LVFTGKNWSDPLDEQGFVTRAAQRRKMIHLG
jgi:hypothetical protein